MIVVSKKPRVHPALLVVSLILTAGCSDSFIAAPDPAAVNASVAAVPRADFTYRCTGIVCEFFSANVLSKSAHWSFGHDASGVSPHVHHTFPVAGRSYVVTFNAIDVDDRAHTVARGVNILSLSGSSFRIRGGQATLLSWAPAAGDVRILRDGVIVKSFTALENQGSWIDNLDSRRTTPATYQVCELAGENCSDPISVAAAAVDKQARK